MFLQNVYLYIKYILRLILVHVLSMNTFYIGKLNEPALHHPSLLLVLLRSVHAHVCHNSSAPVPERPAALSFSLSNARDLFIGQWSEK